MDSNNDTLDFFAFVERTHPFFPAIDEFRRRVRDSEAFQGFAADAGSDRCAVHAELKGELDARGDWRLQRFYWSYQRPDRRSPCGFQAGMLYHRLPATSTDVYDDVYQFPRDPYLGTMADVLGGAPGDGRVAGERIEVLRYVPLRRLTYLVHRRGGALPLVGKLKRRSKIHEAYDKQAAVHRAVRTRALSFAVARPVAVDDRRCLFFQEALPGRSLASVVTASNCLEIMARVGEIHRELHTLTPAGMRPWNLAEYLDTIARDVSWIAYFRPDAAPALRHALDLLRAHAPQAAAAGSVFCHGDFVPSQLLVGDAHWGIIDFDLARYGDADQEIGTLTAALKYDLPFLRQAFAAGAADADELAQAAEDAYLHGYARGAGGPRDRRRQAWFRACAEIHCLALMLTKDAYRPALFDRVVAGVEALARRAQTTRG